MIQIFISFMLPVFFILFENKIKLIKSLSPVVCCYLAGILLSHTMTLDLNLSHKIAETVVPLSLPLLLLPTDIKKWLKLAPSTIFSFLFVIVSVFLATYIGCVLYQNQLDEIATLGGMIAAVFIGGTANLTAVGMALNVDKNSFLLLNGSEMLVGGIYLFLTLTIVPKLFSKILKPYQFKTEDFEHTIEHEFFEKMSFKDKMQKMFILFLLSAALLGTSIGISFLIFKKIEPLLVILMISSLGIVFSFNQKLRHIPGSFELGNYFLLTFCLVIGSMVNVQDIINGSMTYISFVTVILVLTILFHLIFCIIFKIDRDTAIITSTAGIYGPPFIGPVVQVLKNKEMMVSGVTTGIIGIALGTYLGIFFASFF